MTSSEKRGLAGRTFPEYFTELSANYARSTGNSTYKIILEYLRTANPPIVDSSSSINDNACGPGVATAAIIEHLGEEPKSIVANDSVPAMINAVEQRIQALGWQRVKSVEMDSHSLKLPDDMFDVSVSNISITNYQDPVQCLKEMRRTLKPDGLVVVTIWKRFGVADLIHAVQKLVRADAELMKIPKVEFMQKGCLQDIISKAGFREVKTEKVTVLCKDEEVDGLKEFMLGDFTRIVRAPWTDAEKEKWPGAVDAALREEVAKYGGVRFEAWVVSGRK